MRSRAPTKALFQYYVFVSFSNMYKTTAVRNIHGLNFLDFVSPPEKRKMLKLTVTFFERLTWPWFYEQLQSLIKLRVHMLCWITYTFKRYSYLSYDMCSRYDCFESLLCFSAAATLLLNKNNNKGFQMYMNAYFTRGRVHKFRNSK